jgi:hypothetical protein
MRLSGHAACHQRSACHCTSHQAAADYTKSLSSAYFGHVESPFALNQLPAGTGR